MSRKQMISLALGKIRQNPEAKEKYIDFEILKTKGSFKVMTREERIKEASKPLFLKRYE